MWMWHTSLGFVNTCFWLISFDRYHYHLVSILLTGLREVGFYFFITTLMFVLCCFLGTEPLARWWGLCRAGRKGSATASAPRAYADRQSCRRLSPFQKLLVSGGGWPLEDAPGPALEASPGWAGAAPGTGLCSAPGGLQRACGRAARLGQPRCRSAVQRGPLSAYRGSVRRPADRGGVVVLLGIAEVSL